MSADGKRPEEQLGRVGVSAGGEERPERLQGPLVGRPAGLSEQAQPGRWARLTPTARRTMAQFLFEADLHGLLKLDTPIPNAPPARWQRKAKESGPGPSPVGVSPMKPANRSHSSSKTPSKTPGELRPPAAKVECGSLAQAACL